MRVTYFHASLLRPHSHALQRRHTPHSHLHTHIPPCTNGYSAPPSGSRTVAQSFTYEYGVRPDSVGSACPGPHPSVHLNSLSRVTCIPLARPVRTIIQRSLAAAHGHALTMPH